MLKPGDKIVCVDVLNKIYTYKLERYKIYILKSIEYCYTSEKNYFSYYKIEEEPYRYFPDRFIDLKEYRKQKLNKICLI